MQIAGDIMKIGKFASEQGISVHAVRHYIDIGLIAPVKEGGQYSFGDACKNDIRKIIELKNMGFCLEDIKKILTYERLGRLYHESDKKSVENIFREKLKSINEEIETLEAAEAAVKKRIDSFECSERSKAAILGVDFFMLSMLRCVKCGGKLELSEGMVLKGLVTEGTLKCSCGEEYRIKEGIIVTPYSLKESDFEEGIDYIDNYIKDTSPKYLDNVYKNLEWMKSKIEVRNLKGKIILELGSGIGFFLRNFYTDIDDDTVYIAVDHDYERHRFLKKMLEASGIRKRIMFLCTDFTSMPIEDKVADILFDFSGTSNFSFKNKEFLINEVKRYIKEESPLYGTYIAFNKFKPGGKIDISLRSNFTLEWIKDSLLNAGFSTIEDCISDEIDEGGKYESYFVQGEKVFMYLFHGKYSKKQLKE